MRHDLPKSRELGIYYAIGQVGLEMVAPIALGVFLDRWLGTTPILIVVGVLVGFVGGMVHLLALVKRLDRSDSDKNSQRDDA